MSLEDKIKKESFGKRLVVPVAIVFLTMVATGLIYKNSWLIPHDGIRQYFASVIAVPFFLSIGFGTLVVYPMAFFRGASTSERIMTSLFTPMVWILKEIVRVTAFFPLGESIYFGLNQLFLLTIVGAFAQMGLCEVICRWRLKKQGQEQMRLFSATAIACILFGVVGIYVLFIWGWGTGFFYIYMEGYKAIFQ